MSAVKMMPTPEPDSPLGAVINQLKERAGVLLKELERYHNIEDELRKVTRAIKVLMGETLGKPRGKTSGKPGKPGRKPKLIRNQGKKGVSRNAIEMILRAHPKGLTIKQLQTELAEKAKIKLSTPGIYHAMQGKVKTSKQEGTPALVYHLK